MLEDERLAGKELELDPDFDPPSEIEISSLENTQIHEVKNTNNITKKDLPPDMFLYLIVPFYDQAKLVKGVKNKKSSLQPLEQFGIKNRFNLELKNFVKNIKERSTEEIVAKQESPEYMVKTRSSSPTNAESEKLVDMDEQKLNIEEALDNKRAQQSTSLWKFEFRDKIVER